MSAPIRVLTWNLWGRFGDWERRRDAIVATLRTLAPDVCALQEVSTSPEEDLAASLAEGLGMHPASRAGGNAILSRSPVGQSDALDLPGNERRTAAFALVEHPAGAIPVFTTQLNSSPTDSATRCAQVAALAEFVARRSAGRAPIVTGDLNAEPDSDEVRLLQGHKTAPAVPGLALLDAWRYADPDDRGWTWDPRNPLARATFDLGARIDYVLVGMVDGRRSVRSVRVVADRPIDGVWPSDHFGVMAELDPAALIATAAPPVTGRGLRGGPLY